MELTFKSGNVELAEHIPMKNENFGKVLVIRDDLKEGVWVAFSEEDKKKYDDDELSGEVLTAVLVNPTLSGVPWGAYIRVTLNGENRPTCEYEDVFGDSPDFVIADWAAKMNCEGVYGDLQAGKYTIDDMNIREFLTEQLKTAPESDITAALKQLLES